VLGLGHYLDGKMEMNVRNIAAGYREFATVTALNERGMQVHSLQSLNKIKIK
jgi:hypothetical protein